MRILAVSVFALCSVVAGPAWTQDEQLILECGVLAKIAEPRWTPSNDTSLYSLVLGILTEDGHSDFQAGYFFGVMVEMETDRITQEAARSSGTTHWEIARREFHRKGCDRVR